MNSQAWLHLGRSLGFTINTLPPRSSTRLQGSTDGPTTTPQLSSTLLRHMPIADPPPQE